MSRAETRCVDTKESVSKTFELSQTKARVDIVDKAKGTHPIITVNLSTGDTRLIENIQMTVIGHLPETRSVQLEFKQVSADSSHGFGIESVRRDGGRILIGNDVAIALGRITSFGRGVFYMSAPRNIRVHSRERITQS
ncbi:MAG: hypothetical protein UU05_C0031G0005 [Candidatus Curtissbacteria bacterium GW2011_GWA1_40_47]|uniref:Uncharacterized protein n=1 Tax=Candidatus Curtissbacteria bacterium RIFOXYA1_FULL_41_14 TaxID=1797737 RepID=A0A1F5HAQ1_9BACT|nr:MAG: hypothetical protein UT95_C0044G0005 [Candidatus Curtissbacteria bacterium GW2011_GWB1_40_28]KKR60738.1 MAG: hypothetical protein UT99_C0008G0007 [Candidatus Curtissbacteria bacterium GW2011_GWA2_40_31]KKR61627.1 MAG: hypothetical protein UU00_C0010G0015 [Microgenomates group bacterium GW2011_GWC1_40_35]KKR65015.1 MAG: hypothetical protein UU05_C0031G0005 [Candidatus Curtissbacteria bacterium GW2011_GWA1_40_47]KKR77818.1 MAG: hypothetical protein UU19_C0002G0008 [Candidatus Curtissbacte